MTQLTYDPRQLPILHTAVIDATANISGGSVYVQELLPRLVQLMPDWRFVIYGPAPLRNNLPPASPRLMYTTTHLPIPKSSLVWPGIAKLFWRIAIFPLLALCHRPSIIITTANISSPIFRLIGVPCTICLHNLTPFHSPTWYNDSTLGAMLRNRLLKWLTAYTARHAAVVIAFSEYARRLLVDRKVDTAHIETIYHGSPMFADNRWRGAASNCIAIVSHYLPYKRIEIAIRAMGMLMAAGHHDLQLVVHGHISDERYYSNLLEMVSAHGLQKKVFLGQGLAKRELEQLYTTSRALIFPAIGENCPITLLEAMAFGLPIIAADCPPAPELCGNAAAYFREGDPAACAKTILDTTSNSARLCSMSSTGFIRSRNFTWETAAAKTASRLRWQTEPVNL